MRTASPNICYYHSASYTIPNAYSQTLVTVTFKVKVTPSQQFLHAHNQGKHLLLPQWELHHHNGESYTITMVFPHAYSQCKHVLLPQWNYTITTMKVITYTITTVSTCILPVQTLVTTTVKITPSELLLHAYSQSKPLLLPQWKLHHQNYFYMHTASPNLCYYHSENYTIRTISTCIQPVQTLVTTTVKITPSKMCT